jgi:hypothetical protein
LSILNFALEPGIILKIPAGLKSYSAIEIPINFTHIPVIASTNVLKKGAFSV